MDKITLLLVGMSGILGEIVSHAVRRQPDIDVLDSVARDGDAISLACEHGVEVIVGRMSDAQVREQYERLLEDRLNLKFIAINEDGRCACRYELRPHAVPLGEPGPDVLIASIREAAGRA